MQLVPLSTDGRVVVCGAAALPGGPQSVVLRPDGDAVALEIPGPAGPRRVGHLAPDDAEAYGPVLATLAARGLFGTCPARVTGGGARPVVLTLKLAAPSSCVLGNAPGDLELLAAERTVTVTVDCPPDVVARHSGRVAVALVPCTISAGTYAGHAALEVRLDGRRLGELSRRMSERYGPVAGAVAARGGRPGCEALLHRRDGRVHVELRLPAVDVLSPVRVPVPDRAAPEASTERLVAVPSARRRGTATSTPLRPGQAVVIPPPRTARPATAGITSPPARSVPPAGGPVADVDEPTTRPVPAAAPRERLTAPASAGPPRPPAGSVRAGVLACPVHGPGASRPPVPPARSHDAPPGLSRGQRRRVLWFTTAVAAVLTTAAVVHGPETGAPQTAATTRTEAPTDPAQR
jgi:hypothetical protein